jgi:hypothetical protein
MRLVERVWRLAHPEERGKLPQSNFLSGKRNGRKAFRADVLKLTELL